LDKTSTTGPEFAHACFDDVDLFADWVMELDWAVESTQISSGPYRLEFETIEFPDLSVSRLTTRQSVRDRFSVPKGAVVFNIPRKKLPAIWNGKRLPPTMMGIYQPGIDHWVVLPAGWDGYEFTVSENLIQQTELFPDGFTAKRHQFEHALPLMEPVTGHYIGQLDAFFALARNDQKWDGAAASTIPLFDIVMQGLLEILDAGLIAEDKHKLIGVRRSDLVKKATDFVEARLESDLSMQDLTQELRVSARVLNYAFKDNLGISPYRYILTRKLHAVRQELKFSKEAIVEIIPRYGFATPSRFGRQYTQLFGERPSATRYRR
jgi:AraC family ethanolamine operon transcriptional activator